MSSRFYLETTVVQTSGVTTIDSTWDTDCRTAQGIPGRTFKLIPSGTTPIGVSYSTPSGIPAVAAPLPRHTMHAMFEYTMPAGLLITGNVRGEFAGYRTNNLDNISNNVAVHIRNGTTHKATVVTRFTASNFYGFNPGHVQAMLATPIVDDGYITVAGDVLYCELGLGWSATPQAVASVTVGYNNANIDWADGADGTPDANPTTHNPWFEFMTTLGAAPAADDFLPTLSATTVAARPSAPSKPGLHFYDRTSHILSIWDGTSWTNVVSSISGTTGGALNFSGTTSISVTISGVTFTWTNLYGAPSGGYGTGVSAGTTNTTSLASDARFLFPSALMPVGTSKTLTLTDDATAGALVTADNAFLANALTFVAPNRVTTHAYAVGRYGNLQSGSGSLDDVIQFNMRRIDGISSSILQGLNVTVTNTDAGNGTIAARGGLLAATGSASTLAAPSSAIQVVGYEIQAIGGAGTNNNFQGSVLGLKANILVSGASVSNPVSSLTALQSTGTITRSAVTDFIGWNALSPSLLINGTISNEFGGLINAQNRGLTQRVGLKVVGAASGSTPTVSYGFWSTGHNIGTTRRSFIGDNSFEAALSDLIFSTTAKGPIFKDSQGTPEFWRTYVDSTGLGDAALSVDQNGFVTGTRGTTATGIVTVNIRDIGTAAPAT
jgi:hypothetical protein